MDDPGEKVEGWEHYMRQDELGVELSQVDMLLSNGSWEFSSFLVCTLVLNVGSAQDLSAQTRMR